MTPKDFEPPRHVETHACVFDKKSGVVLATHTLWTDEGAPRRTTPISRELVNSIARASGKTAKALDVLVTKRDVSGKQVRVDVAARKVIARPAKKQQGLAPPNLLGRP
jgi:hypothetical protein